MSNQDTAAKNKTLSEAERKRLERFDGISKEMEQHGYTRRNLTISMGKANLFAVLLFILLFIAGYGLNYLINGSIGFGDFSLLFFIVAFVVLIVVHELIHGLFWSLFTPNHFKDIEFGIMKPSMSPYCTCLAPLEKTQYIIGTVMPLLLLGILPMSAGIVMNNTNLLFMGIVMAVSAAGDILIICRLLGYRSKGGETVYMDHPTKAGCVVFER